MSLQFGDCPGCGDYKFLDEQTNHCPTCSVYGLGATGWGQVNAQFDVEYLHATTDWPSRLGDTPSHIALYPVDGKHAVTLYKNGRYVVHGSSESDALDRKQCVLDYLAENTHWNGNHESEFRFESVQQSPDL